MAEYDQPWKEALEQAFDRVVAFFFPALNEELDWGAGYESLDTELRKLLPEAAVGRRVSDALVKGQARDRGEGVEVRYVHVEVQCQVEDGEVFVNRLDDYNNLFKTRYNHPIITVVILGDDNPNWRPTRYLFTAGGFRKEITFPAAKLLDYRGREGELEGHANPVALLVLAHLLTLSTRREDEPRREGKLRLLKNLLDRKMEAEEGRLYQRLIDWLVVLPAEGQRWVWKELRQYAEEGHVPFLSYPEQVGYDKGKEDGVKEERRRGLLQAIEFGLDLKFKSEGLQLLPAIQAQQDLAVLQAIFAALKLATSLDEVRRLLPPAQA